MGTVVALGAWTILIAVWFAGCCLLGRAIGRLMNDD